MNSSKCWCSFHQKWENIDDFYESTKGIYGVCKEAHKFYMNDYNDRHRDAVNEKNSVYQNYYSGKITEQQKINKIRGINSRYGITSRI